MAQTLSMIAPIYALIALGVILWSRYRMQTGSVRSRGSYTSLIVLSAAILVGTLPGAAGLESSDIKLAATVLSLVLTTIAITLQIRERKLYR